MKIDEKIDEKLDKKLGEIPLKTDENWWNLMKFKEILMKFDEIQWNPNESLIETDQPIVKVWLLFCTLAS